jgi:hypothetical protein
VTPVENLLHCRAFVIFMRIASMVALFGSALQADFFYLRGLASGYRLSGIVVALLTATILIKGLLTKNNRIVMAGYSLYLVQLLVFAANFIRHEGPPPFRMLQVTIFSTYAAPVLAGLLTRFVALAPDAAFRLASSILFAFLVAEAMVNSPVVWEDPHVISRLITEMEPDPRLGAVNVPNTTVSAVYRGNPHAGFQEQGTRNQWWLRFAGKSAAQLQELPDPDAIRVNISRVSADKASYVQLDVQKFTVAADARYSLTFCAKAQSPRQMFVGLVSGKTWQGLGLYKKVALKSSWQNVKEEFTVTVGDQDALIFFDLGDSDIAVELSSIRLHTLQDGAPLVPRVPEGGYVENYHFNNLGCRGGDYAIPKPAKTTRVLLLGNSFTLGAGVSIDATFAGQLERLLNSADTSSKYEVINCGAAGYGVREDRLFYTLFAEKYQPDTVLLGLTWADYMTYAEARAGGLHQSQPDKLGYLFHTLGLLENYLRPSAMPDYSRCLDEIRQLNDESRKRGARMAAFVFRNNIDYSGTTQSGRIWNRASSSLTEGLRAAGVPALAFGNVLARDYPAEELGIHAQIGSDPNEVAHQVAAQELLTFLRTEHLLHP